MSTKLLHAERAWIELSTENLKHNVAELRRIMPSGCELMAIVKAESYGHGAKEIPEILSSLGVAAFGVATVDEGIALRESGTEGEILILGYTDPRRADDLERYRLIQTLFDLPYAEALEAEGREIGVHIAIDSGMHRIGLAAEDTADIIKAFSFPHLRVEGMFTHLCASDTEDAADVAYTEAQIAAFSSLTERLTAAGISLPKLHIQSSYGLVNYPSLRCAYARIGILLYGADSELGNTRGLSVDLRPVMSLRSKVIQLRDLPAGEPVGYGRAFITSRPTRLAVLPIGYADGLPRHLSGGNGEVLLCGKRAPILGRVCMDQVIVDVTNIPDITLGTVATLIGRDGDDEITAEEMADRADTITNEIFSRLGRRLKIEIL